MGFSASTRQLGDVTVVEIRGRFTMIEGEALHDLILDLFRDGKKKVLLNLKDVSYLDSSGVGQLVRALCSAGTHDAELKMVDLNPRAQEVIRITNLHTVFADFPDEQTALRSFSS
ncbi:MAG: STAS domain-containing protein [Candidatus Acidiferrales bacterium]